MRRENLPTRRDETATRRAEPTRNIEMPMLACDEGASLPSPRLRVEPWGHENTAMY